MEIPAQYRGREQAYIKHTLLETYLYKLFMIVGQHQPTISYVDCFAGPWQEKARPMQQDWVLNIKRQCEEQHSAFFFKQWGGWGADGTKRAKKQNGRLLQGRTWDAVPAFVANIQIQSLTR